MSQNSNPITDGVKKLLLAGVGAVALTGEKAGDVINTLLEMSSWLHMALLLNREKNSIKN